MTPPATDLVHVLPELALLAGASLVLIGDLFVPAGRRHLTYWATQAVLLVTALLVLGTWSARPTLLFNGLAVDDLLGDVLGLLCCLTVIAILAYSRTYAEARGLFRGELFVLALFGLLGMMVMVSAHHLLTLYLGLELLSLSLYAMVALQRDSRECSEAAMKYFVLGALASGLLLYGMSMVYGATGALDIGAILRALEEGRADRTVLAFGLVFLVSGVAFKLGVVPYHMWVPDVYHGAPTAVTTFVGTAPKLAAFGFVMRLLVGALEPLVADWQGMLVILSALSLAVGNTVAIAQTNVKRMLAYSAIANMGFMLLGVLAGDIGGYGAAMFYTVTYVLTALAGFGVLLLLSREGFESDRLEDFRGLNQRSPWYAFAMLVVMFSLAGIPPTVGFYAKLSVIEAVINAGFVWLAVAAVLASLVGAFFYLRLVKLMYFDEPVGAVGLVARRDTRVLLSANALAIVVFGVLPQPLMGLCAIALGHSL